MILADSYNYHPEPIFGFRSSQPFVPYTVGKLSKNEREDSGPYLEFGRARPGHGPKTTLFRGGPQLGSRNAAFFLRRAGPILGAFRRGIEGLRHRAFRSGAGGSGAGREAIFLDAFC